MRPVDGKMNKAQRARQNLIETFANLPPEQRAHAVAASIAANRRQDKPPVEIDWNAAIASLQQMLAERYPDCQYTMFYRDACLHGSGQVEPYRFPIYGPHPEDWNPTG